MYRNISGSQIFYLNFKHYFSAQMISWFGVEYFYSKSRFLLPPKNIS